MRHYPLPLRILALTLITVLLAVRFGSYTEQVFVTPTEDILFDVPFMTTDNSDHPGITLKVKPKRVFECELLTIVEFRVPAENLDSGQRPVMVVNHPLGLPSEIFIPPEALSC